MVHAGQTPFPPGRYGGKVLFCLLPVPYPFSVTCRSPEFRLYCNGISHFLEHILFAALSDGPKKRSRTSLNRGADTGMVDRSRADGVLCAAVSERVEGVKTMRNTSTTKAIAEEWNR